MLNEELTSLVWILWKHPSDAKTKHPVGRTIRADHVVVRTDHHIQTITLAHVKGSPDVAGYIKEKIWHESQGFIRKRMVPISLKPR